MHYPEAISVATRPPPSEPNGLKRAYAAGPAIIDSDREGPRRSPMATGEVEHARFGAGEVYPESPRVVRLEGRRISFAIRPKMPSSLGELTCERTGLRCRSRFWREVVVGGPVAAHPGWRREPESPDNW